MALSTPTLLTTLSDGSPNKESYTSASVSPASNCLLVVLGMADADVGTLLAVPTITTGLSNVGTWTVITQYNGNTGVTGGYGIVAYATVTGAPGSGTLTFDFGTGNGRDNLILDIHYVTGHDTTTPVQQSAGLGTGTTPATSISTTFGATPASTSLVMVATETHCATNSADPITQRSGFTETADSFQWNSTYGFGNQKESQYLLTSATTTISATWGTSTDASILGIEINQAAGAATKAIVIPPRSRFRDTLLRR